MKEKTKTVWLWCVAGAVLLVSFAAIYLTAPTPFSSYVTSREDIESSVDEIRCEEEKMSRIDVNTDSLEELMLLPDMTEEMATEILFLRHMTVDDRFLDISQWLRVPDVTIEMIEEWRELTFCE